MARGRCVGCMRRRWGGLRCGRWCAGGCFRGGLGGGCGVGGVGGGWGSLCGSSGLMRGSLSAGWGSLCRSTIFFRASFDRGRVWLRVGGMWRCFRRMGGIWVLRMFRGWGGFMRRGRCLILGRCWGMGSWRSVTGGGRWCVRGCVRWIITGFISRSGGGPRGGVC